MDPVQHKQVFLRINEVAEIIGMGRSKTYMLVASGEIPSVYIGGSKSRRVPRAALDRWIESQIEGGTDR